VSNKRSENKDTNERENPAARRKKRTHSEKEEKRETTGAHVIKGRGPQTSE
jgi:hypothetical protein